MELKLKLENKSGIFQIPGIPTTLMADEKIEDTFVIDEENYEVLKYLLSALQENIVSIADKDAKKKIVKLTETFQKLGTEIAAVKDAANKGKIFIRLAKGRAIWQNNDGTILLSTIGNIQKIEVDLEKLNPREKAEITDAIKFRILELTDEKAVNSISNFSIEDHHELATRAREQMYNILGDYDYPDFEAVLKEGKYKAKDLEILLKVFKRIESREQHIALIEKELRKVA